MGGGPGGRGVAAREERGVEPSPRGGRFAGRRVLLGVTGGIAAYKAAELARALTEAGAEVRVVMTEAAREFVSPVTFAALTGNPVYTDLFSEPEKVLHIRLAREAEVVVVAPATARLMARLAAGIADDLLTSVLLATRAPVVLAPAMHTEMWDHPATRANLRKLVEMGVSLVPPDEGRLASGDWGVGRLAALERILEAVEEALAARASLAGLKVVVSAGGTREPLDAVRFIGNPSTGRMGYAMAAEALRRGARVTLVTGPTELPPPPGAEVIRVMTAEEMRRAVLEAAAGADVVVMAAAVADWRPSRPWKGKRKKGEKVIRLVLEPTPDILSELGASKGERFLVGFAAEWEDLEENARQKLVRKNLDLVVANDVSAPDSGFAVETNRAVLIWRSGEVERLPLMRKEILAREVWERVARALAARSGPGASREA